MNAMVDDIERALTSITQQMKQVHMSDLFSSQRIMFLALVSFQTCARSCNE